MALLTIAALAAIDSSVLIGFWFSGTALFGAATVLLSKGTEEIYGIWIASAIGAFIGEQASFAAGRLGEVSLRRRLTPVIARAEKLRRLIERFGLYSVIPGRFFAVTRKLLPFVLGASQASYVRFVPVSGVACLLWVTFWCAVLNVSVKYGIDAAAAIRRLF